MLSSFTFSHFWEDNIMFSALAGRHGHGVCKVICFLRGTFLGSDFHFPLWVWCDWQRARCSCVAHTDVKNTQLWESEITIQRGGGKILESQTLLFDLMDYVPLAMFTFVICSFSYNIEKSIRGGGFLWGERNTGSILFNASLFKLTNFDKRLLGQGGYVWLVSICWLVGNPIVNINVLLCWIFWFSLAVFMLCVGLGTKST